MGNVPIEQSTSRLGVLIPAVSGVEQAGINMLCAKACGDGGLSVAFQSRDLFFGVQNLVLRECSGMPK